MPILMFSLLERRDLRVCADTDRTDITKHSAGRDIDVDSVG